MTIQKLVIVACSGFAVSGVPSKLDHGRREETPKEVSGGPRRLLDMGGATDNQ